MIPKSFTIDYNTRVNVIKTKCHIGAAFNSKIESPKQLKEYVALWDTGATASVITQKVVDELGLMQTGMQKVYHANGCSIVPTYLIALMLPNKIGFSFLQVTLGNLHDIDILIGMDIISQGDFAISNYNGNTTFSFRCPTLKRIDFVEEYNSKTPIINESKIGRNVPCPCGSGKKYKHCCGN